MRTAHAVPFAMVLAGMRMAKDTAGLGATPAKRPRGSVKQAANYRCIVDNDPYGLFVVRAELSESLSRPPAATHHYGWRRRL
jgi:hypothetical protein